MKQKVQAKGDNKSYQLHLQKLWLMGWKVIGYYQRSTFCHRFPDIIPINQTCRHKIKCTLYPQGNIFGLYLAHRSPHRVQLDIGHCRRGCRDEIMHQFPIPRHQFHRVWDTGKKDEADREEGDHQKRRIGVRKEQGRRKPEKTSRQQERNHQHNDI